jgi:hypothetical protein
MLHTCDNGGALIHSHQNNDAKIFAVVMLIPISIESIYWFNNLAQNAALRNLKCITQTMIYRYQ